MERDYSIIVELKKNGHDVVNSLSLDPDLDINNAVYGIKQKFDEGDADEATIFISSTDRHSDDGFIDALTVSAGDFDIKEVAAGIEESLYGVPV